MGFAKVILKNDDTHTSVDVMELFTNLDLDYDTSNELIDEIEAIGEAIIIHSDYATIIFNYMKYLEDGNFDYEIII